MEYVSKLNKKSLSKYSSLEKKKKELEKKASFFEEEMEKLKLSIPYPIFVKGNYQSEFIGFFSSRKCIKVKKARSPSNYNENYHISIIDLDAENVDKITKQKGIQIYNIDKRITKQEFMEIYNEAMNSIKEVMVFSKKAKKEILCEKILIND